MSAEKLDMLPLNSLHFKYNLNCYSLTGYFRRDNWW